MSVYVNLESNGGFGGFTPAAFAVADGPYGVAQAGDVAVNTSINAALAYTSIVSIAGSVQLNTTIAANIDKANVVTGDITAPTLIAASFLKYNKFVTGVTVNVVPASTLEYVEVRSLAADMALDFSIGSLLEFEDYERIAPSPAVIITGNISQSADSSLGGIDPTVDTDTGSIGETPIWP